MPLPQALIKIPLWLLQDCETSKIRPFTLLLSVKCGLSSGTCVSLQLVLLVVVTNKAALGWLRMRIPGILLLPNSIEKKWMLHLMT